MVKGKAAETGDNDLKVLAPETVTWKVGDQEFEQTPSTLDQLADVMDVIVDEVLSSGNSNLLDKLMDSATAGAADSDEDEDGDASTKAKDVAKSLTSDRELLTGVVRIIATLPRSMPRIAAAILDTPEDYLRANLRPKEAFGILRIFIKQNDVGSIVRDFFALFQEFQTETAPDESNDD